MNVKITRTFLFLVFLNCGFIFSQNKVQKATEEFTHKEVFQNAAISICVFDLDSNVVISSYNEKMGIQSASTAKLFSTATALKNLGPNYKPSTKFYTDGTINDSILNGNLIVEGGGDPTFGSRFFSDRDSLNLIFQKIVDSIYKLGIHKINGDIIIDGSKFSYQGVPDGWAWSDMGNYYGAGPSGIILYDNTLYYHFNTGNQVNKTVKLTSTFPVIPNLQFNNQIIASNKSGDNSYIYGAPFSYDRFGIGSLPVNQKDFVVKGSIPDPEQQFGFELFSILLRKGMIGEKSTIWTSRNPEHPPIKKIKLLLEIEGEKLIDIIYKTNQHSINLFAEQLLFLTSYEKTGYGSTEKGLKIVESTWKNDIDFKGLKLEDGSGLSRSNAISASHFCQLLNGIYKDSIYTNFLSSLPVAGCSGTLKGVCKNQLGHGRVKAKSGTLNNVKAYAGYVETKSGKKIAFAIIVNNFNCSSSHVVDLMEPFFNAMADY